ncbi:MULTISPECIES: hypothetical protein [Serratia]|uniref:hypothetical protein n=1 Tax=Serratia TaxID=613 RepID=UPI0008A90B64|nr:hypothetical protein [Serratia marcescens]OHT41617.1 hypothetical protein BGV45_19350 [Serratia marcescens]OHT42645.1 hypothetical protein BGV46_19570 [Serratia marcescens]
MKRENRYLVIKYKDVIEALTVEQREALKGIAIAVTAHRQSNGKQPLDAVVVEADWPEYEQVWGMIEARVKGDA